MPPSKAPVSSTDRSGGKRRSVIYAGFGDDGGLLWRKAYNMSELIFSCAKTGRSINSGFQPAAPKNRYHRGRFRFVGESRTGFVGPYSMWRAGERT